MVYLNISFNLLILRLILNLKNVKLVIFNKIQLKYVIPVLKIFILGVIHQISYLLVKDVLMVWNVQEVQLQSLKLNIGSIVNTQLNQFNVRILMIVLEVLFYKIILNLILKVSVNFLQEGIYVINVLVVLLDLIHRLLVLIVLKMLEIIFYLE